MLVCAGNMRGDVKICVCFFVCFCVRFSWTFRVLRLTLHVFSFSFQLRIVPIRAIYYSVIVSIVPLQYSAGPTPPSANLRAR